MKKINNMVENSVKSYSQNYISDKDKNKLKKDIKESVFSIVFLLAGFIYGKIFPGQEVIQGSIYLIGVAIIGIPVFVTAISLTLSLLPDFDIESSIFSRIFSYRSEISVKSLFSNDFSVIKVSSLNNHHIVK